MEIEEGMLLVTIKDSEGFEVSVPISEAAFEQFDGYLLTTLREAKAAHDADLP